MTTQHFFLATDAQAIPERWQTAFPTGQVLDWDALALRLTKPDSPAFVCWLMSDDEQWSAWLRRILETRPQTPVVLLSLAPETVEGLRALDAGVRGYTHAYGLPELLQEVALVVGHGGLWVGPELLQRLVGSTSTALSRLVVPASEPQAAARSDDDWALLTARESEVARAVCAGHSNREVAALMFISERTVKAHLGAVFEKLGVRDRLQLALRLGASPDAARASAPGSGS